MRLADGVVLVLYMLVVLGVGALFAGRQRTARDYFLGSRDLPAWAIMFSVVATETSALTVVSLPATAYRGDLWFLQLALGYIVGRVVIAQLLLPGYFRGERVTAYELLGQRFGPAARRFASFVFMLTRLLADSVRMFVAAIPVRLMTGIPYWAAILVSGAATAAYTWVGGLAAVVWVDALQLVVYMAGGIASLIVLLLLLPGGWSGLLQAAGEAGKLNVFHMTGGFSDPQWILTGLVGGAFLSMASHGADQLIVQRLLASRGLRQAQRALIGSGVLVLVQFALFLVIGAGLFVWYGGRTFATPDEIYPGFVLEQLPAGLSGLIVAGILAAMMSTLSSSINSLASSLAVDVWAPLTGRAGDDAAVLRAGRWFSLLWAVLLAGGALVFQFVRQDTPVVIIALQIASFTYGGLLGGFFLGLFVPAARERDALFGMAGAIVLTAALWAVQQFGAVPRFLDALWFSLVGAGLTLALGATSAKLRGRRQPA